MQAGEKLDFVQPFSNESVEHMTCNEDERDGSKLFIQTCLTMLIDNATAVRAEVIFRDGTSRTVNELSLMIDADDGSYLYFVVFAHVDDEGIIDISLNVQEHDVDGDISMGYLYTLNDEGIIRQKSNTTAYGFVDGSEYVNPHFSIIDVYDVYEKFRTLELSEDMEERMMAMDIQYANDEDTMLNNIEVEMGFDGKAPTYEEIENLVQLLESAHPVARA